MSTAKEEATITVSVDPTYAQTILRTFTPSEFPSYEDRYEAAADYFDAMGTKLNLTNANLGGIISFSETGCQDPFTVIFDSEGMGRTV